MDTPLGKDLTNFVINKSYKLLKKIGSGAFGEIYIVQRGKDEFAMKLEKSDTKHPQLFFEAKLYNYLQGSDPNDKGKQILDSKEGLPHVFAQGTDGEFNYMVMDLLGASLEDLFTKNNRKLSLKTVCIYHNKKINKKKVLMIGDQMIQRIEYVHTKQFIHRDIKPDNFLVGAGKRASRVYLVDFGLAKRYMTKEGHIPYKEGKSLTGTARYASINTHLGLEQSRRDDLESLGYVLLYLLRGQLPWQNMKANNQKDKYQRILEKKLETSADLLCKGFPVELSQYINYCRNLKFEEKPDYTYLRGLFKEAFKKSGFEWDNKYEWIKEDQQAKSQTDAQSEKPITQQPILLPKTKNTTQEFKNSTQPLGPRRQQPQQSRLSNQASVEKKRNLSLTKPIISSKDIAKVPNTVLAPKIITHSKEQYKKF